jgi:hypothetical protein
MTQVTNKVCEKDLDLIFIRPGVTAREAKTREFRMWLRNLLSTKFGVEVKENPEVEDTMEGRIEAIKQLVENGVMILKVTERAEI